MIDFEKFELENGLTVIVHEEKQNPQVLVNLLYNVGSRDEKSDKTGFAHLFEHLMFGGSINIPNYDEPLQRAGAENNAFTSPDITNYYVTLPYQNIETALWLESDRMLSLSFDPQVLEIQKSVVIEEFKQRYINQPYGDVWHHLRALCYQEHPYQWPTIGKEISHIENATMDDVKHFFHSHYAPNNAVLVLAGNINLDVAQKLSNKWFGSIPRREIPKRQLPTEPKQLSKREKEVKGNVPADSLYLAFHTCERFHPDYYVYDLLSDILGRGKSSILYRKLVAESQTFTTINCYCTGSLDKGLLIIEGKVEKGKNLRHAEEMLWNVLEEVRTKGVNGDDLRKVKNQAESSMLFGEIELMNRALNLAIFTQYDITENINLEAEKIASISNEQVNHLAKNIFVPTLSNTLRYFSNAS